MEVVELPDLGACDIASPPEPDKLDSSEMPDTPSGNTTSED
jgi:hypothetical protein